MSGFHMTLDNPDAVWFGNNETAPKKGAVLVLNYHHDGESHWCTPEQARARIEFILDGNKDESEWGPRMEAMRIVPFGPWWNKTAGAGAVYNKAFSEAGALSYPAEAWAAVNTE